LKINMKPKSLLNDETRKENSIYKKKTIGKNMCQPRST